jgi:hypothetical protein
MFMMLHPLGGVRRFAPQQNRYVIRFNHARRRASIVLIGV